jgi:hypothetical protein
MTRKIFVFAIFSIVLIVLTMGVRPLARADSAGQSSKGLIARIKQLEDDNVKLSEEAKRLKEEAVAVEVGRVNSKIPSSGVWTSPAIDGDLVNDPSAKSFRIRVDFAKAFASPPKVIVSWTKLDSVEGDGGHLAVRADVKDCDKNGFWLVCQVFSKFSLAGGEVTWTAVGSR